MHYIGSARRRLLSPFMLAVVLLATARLASQSPIVAQMNSTKRDHDGGCSPSINPTKVAHPLDDLARGLPSGSLVQGGPNYSRRKT
jgi:hypothetical protein